MWYWYQIHSGDKTHGLANMKSSDRLTLSASFSEKMGVALQVVGEGGWSYIHSLLQSSSEGTDLERLFSLFDRPRFL